MPSDVRTEEKFAPKSASASNNILHADSASDARLSIQSSSIGDLLQQQRRAQGLSIKDCFMRLRIAPAYLEALEEEDLSKLPTSRTTVRAYVRAYAKMLTLDDDMLVAQFAEQHYPHVEPSLHRQSRPLPTLPTNSILFIVAAILLLLLGIGIFQSYLSSNISAPVDSENSAIEKPPQRQRLSQKSTAAPETATTEKQAIQESEPSTTQQTERLLVKPLPLTAVRIIHGIPIWVKIRNANGVDQRWLLAANEPLNLPFGSGLKLQIADSHDVMISLINSADASTGDVPYGMLANSDNWINLDALTQE